MFYDRINDFIQYLRFEKRYSPNTLIAYRKDLLQFQSYILENFDMSDPLQVTHFHIRSWLATEKEEQDLKARSINRKLSSLNSFYKNLLKKQLIAKNPVKQLHAQKLPERLPVFLKENETETLLDTLVFDEGFKGYTDRMICELLYLTGMRRNELIQLMETDIEWSLNQIRVLGKGNKERLLPIDNHLKQSIKDYINEKQKLQQYNSQYLLNLDNGKQLYPAYVYRIVKKYLTLSTTLHKKSPHVLRHTFATHLLNKGANIQAIKDLLGHSSLAATQIYTHNNIERLKEIHKLNHPRG
jgi:integrase/recombinase XerC